MRLLAPVRRRLARRVLARSTANGLDLRQLRFLPEAVQLPLKRDGLDPLPEITDLRAEEPVTRLTELFGRGVWLVTGYDEARAVLADNAGHPGHVFNLGHGVHPTTDPGVLAAIVDLVHEAPVPA